MNHLRFSLLLLGIVLSSTNILAQISKTPKLHTENRQLLDLETLNQEIVKLYQEGKYKEAVPLAVQGTKIAKLIHGEDHLEYAMSLYILAELYKSQYNFIQAESYLY